MVNTDGVTVKVIQVFSADGEIFRDPILPVLVGHDEGSLALLLLSFMCFF